VKRTRQERIRLGVLFVLMGLFFAAVIGRLIYLQILKGPEYSQVVERQSSGKVAIPAERGLVYDRYGNLVAKNVTRHSLYAHPDSKKQTGEVAAYLDRLLDLRRGQALKKYRLEENRFRWIERHISDELAARVTADSVPGLYLREEAVRQYPYGNVGKQIIGYTNIDGQGLSGFELACDSLLAGRNGWADIRRDGRREIYRVHEQALIKPEPGQSLVLTVDSRLQEMTEQELAAAVHEFGARSGMAAFVDCTSGDILALAHYDPEEKNPDKPTKLCAISDLFEPGSAFKPFTAATLLDAGVVDFKDSVYCEMGAWPVNRRVLHDDKKHGFLRFRQIIELSSNIGLAKWAIGLDGPEFIDTYRRFGFGQKTGCGLPGEASGRVFAPPTWSDYNIAALAMGHSVSVTALQMTMAMAAIANGGELLEPRLVLGTVGDDGLVQIVGERQVVRRALEPHSADSLTAFLRGVVEKGTGKPANSEYIAIAGKTGTAEIVNTESGGYIKDHFMASFCGFFPHESPVVAGIVVLKDPRPITYGGYTSGKAFRRIAERYSACNPDLIASRERTFVADERPLQATVMVPNFVGRHIEQARLLAETRGVKLRDTAEDGIVSWQYPSPERLVFSQDEVVVAVRSTADSCLHMPDLSGMTIRKASAFLCHLGINLAVEGSGEVFQQSIPPGTALVAGTTCRLVCKPEEEWSALSDSLSS